MGQQKKCIVGCGLIIIAFAMLCFYELPWRWHWRREVRLTALVGYLILMGATSPTIEGAVLPDMLDSVQRQEKRSVPAVVDEHTTNLVTAMFTTACNLSGVLGPQLAYLVVPALGFRHTYVAIGIFIVPLSVV